MPRWKWALLLTELVLFALILILPQVALPDFTFHSGTAPVSVKLRSSSGSSAIHVIAGLTSLVLPHPAVEPRADKDLFLTTEGGHTRLALFCVLIC